MSELASMMPTSGGQYFWVSVLAPESSRKFAGYLIGWLTITGWQSLVASGGFVTGTMIQGLILLNHPEYLPNMQNWHGTMLFWGVVLAAFSINTIFGKLLSRFEGFILILHILGFFAILLPLVFMSKEKSDTEAVFLTWINLGEWQTQELSFCIGILGNVFAFLGADGAIHVSSIQLVIFCGEMANRPGTDGRGNPKCVCCHSKIHLDWYHDQRIPRPGNACCHAILYG